MLDDGLPDGNSLAVAWRQVSGPAGAVLADLSSAITAVTFPQPGVWEFELGAADGELATSDTVAVTVSPKPNEAPVVDAGPDRTVAIQTGIQLTGIVTDDGLPAGGGVTVQWRMVSGPVPVRFASPASASTRADFDVVGNYVLQLVASDGSLSGSDLVTLRVVSAPVVRMTSPANRSVFAPGAPVPLAAEATDDGEVTGVEFYRNEALAAVAHQAPFGATLSGVEEGVTCRIIRRRICRIDVVAFGGVWSGGCALPSYSGGPVRS